MKFRPRYKIHLACNHCGATLTVDTERGVEAAALQRAAAMPVLHTCSKGIVGVLWPTHMEEVDERVENGFDATE